ncbi:hypothetical protein [Furfurilactobacillus cerevisiae]|uniref:hypothetical protein n=1 Tax=Furfurilactobacillus rossiae TaxID=231049 RepID=UPI003B981017
MKFHSIVLTVFATALVPVSFLSVNAKANSTIDPNSAWNVLMPEVPKEELGSWIPFAYSKWIKSPNGWQYESVSGDQGPIVEETDSLTLATGWQFISGTWYYFAPDGVMQTGWQYVDNGWFYFNTNGQMQTVWQQINGNWYYLNQNGRMQTGWQFVDNGWFYFNGNGQMLTGWQMINNNWFYFNSNGRMQTGWQYINSSWYYLNNNGYMQKGWQYINGNWYFMTTNGQMQNSGVVDGWQISASGAAFKK